MVRKSVLTVLSVLLNLTRAFPQAYICPEGESEVQLQTYAVEYLVLINQFFESNTIINVGGITININNAPTQLSTIVTATSTATVTNTIGGTATTAPVGTQSASESLFMLQVGPALVARRQWLPGETSFVGAKGQMIGTCDEASPFTIRGNKIFNGTDEVSTNFGASSLPFASSPIIGDIDTTFSMVGGVLVWKNPNFVGGAASFGVLNGTVLAIFDQMPPENCVPAQLVQFAAASCPGLSISALSSTILPSPTSSSTLSASSTLSSSTLSPTLSTSSTSPSEISSSATLSSTNLASTATGTSSSTPTSTASVAVTPLCDTTSSYLNTTTNSCDCALGYSNVGAPSNGLSCEPVPLCDTTTTSLNTTTNSCACSKNYTMVGAPAGGLSCVPVVLCDTTTTSLNTTTNSCACSKNYTMVGARAGGLSCVPVALCDPSSTSVNAVSNTCTCLSGYTTAGAPSNGLSCNKILTCDTTTSSLNSTTNTCTCIANTYHAGNPLTCRAITTCTQISPVYTSPNGVSFNTNCGDYYGATATNTGDGINQILATTAPDLAACFDLCSTNTTCVAVDFDSFEVPPGCTLLSNILFGEGTGFDSGTKIVPS